MNAWVREIANSGQPPERYFQSQIESINTRLVQSLGQALFAEQAHDALQRDSIDELVQTLDFRAGKNPDEILGIVGGDLERYMAFQAENPGGNKASVSLSRVLEKAEISLPATDYAAIPSAIVLGDNDFTNSKQAHQGRHIISIPHGWEPTKLHLKDKEIARAYKSGKPIRAYSDRDAQTLSYGALGSAQQMYHLDESEIIDSTRGIIKVKEDLTLDNTNKLAKLAMYGWKVAAADYREQQQVINHVFGKVIRNKHPPSLVAQAMDYADSLLRHDAMLSGRLDPMLFNRPNRVNVAVGSGTYAS